MAQQTSGLTINTCGKQVNFTFPSGALGKLTGLDDTNNKHGVFLTIFES